MSHIILKHIIHIIYGVYIHIKEVIIVLYELNIVLYECYELNLKAKITF